MTLYFQSVLLFATLTPFILAFAPRGMAALLAASTLGLIAVTLIGKVRLPPIKYKSLTLPTLSLALVAASSMWSDSPRAYEMLRDVSYVVVCAVLFFHLSRGWDADFTRQMHRVLAVAFAVALAAFTINLLLDFPLQHSVNSVPNKPQPIIDSNVPKRSAALFVLFMWPVALSLWLAGKRPLAIIALSATTLLTLLFASSTATLGAILGLLTLALSLWRVRVGQSIGLAVLPLGFVLVMAMSLSLPNVPRSLTHELKDTGQYRLEIWNFAARQSLNNMPIGIGLDGSRVLPSNGEISRWNKTDIMPDHPHNMYLQVWLEFGIIGTLLAMALTFVVWFRSYALPRGIQPFVWGYILTSVVTLAIAYGAWQAWWLAGHVLAGVLMVTLVRTYKES